MARNGILGALATFALDALRSATRSAVPQPSRGGSSSAAAPPRDAGRARLRPSRGVQTVELRPEEVRGLRLSYAPSPDGQPDAGEVVWTWVPYAENDGRGKDRPVLVIARESAQRVYAVKLTSKPKDGDREFLSIGTGQWDDSGRPSWVDLDQLYSVHVEGMRREAAALDRERFVQVARALQRLHGWNAGE